MDSIIAYLPSPAEKPPIKDISQEYLIRRPTKAEKLCCYVFKIITDSEKNIYYYLRIYSGVL